MLRAFFYASLIMIFLGALLNFTVISANGWQMPVVGEPGPGTTGIFGMAFFGTVKNCAITEATKLPMLADIYPVRGWRWSIGDFVIMAGAAGALILIVPYFVMLERTKRMAAQAAAEGEGNGGTGL